ncbi:hypothetical protein A3D07_03510 [Candidatus Curtissbacteria bacterium RIFCSPHIGHO2_02_FULL_42_15]|uniref:Peptidase M10 metallopeptidase domain-containing protein n=1 Tax=Candidatus Curtissbacteria bacterium RIFCSPHIGHO2_02_FULL_42_15 TaxID=1797716 RepID=A0A1F5GDZ4_9BACT|nr:MAG: hypothetical protein A3D07_03510 [Candidatus Curtissbacteria bacterium RIFCSPHIGHO2_02_FULL_42_15]
MIKKITAIFSLLNLLLFVNPVLAIGVSSHATKQYDIPGSAVQISDSVYSLGKAKDPKSGKVVEGFAVVHYKNPEGKISKAARAKKTNTCYGYLSTGAKWKTVEPWVINPANTRGLPGDILLNNLTGDISKWEDAADGVATNGKIVNILGDGSITTSDLSQFANTLNSVNEVYFADITTPGVIAVTTVWGFWGGDISTREIVEWDQVYDDVDFGWSVSGESSKMDFDNIATHELGHAAGMADLYTASCSNETMYGYATLGETKKSTLEQGDIRGINLLY